MNYETVPRDLNKGEINEIRIEWTLNPIRPGGGSEARMAKLTAANQKPLIL